MGAFSPIGQWRTMSLCTKMSVLSILTALAAALAYGWFSGEPGALWLAGAIVLVGALGAIVELVDGRHRRQCCGAGRTRKG